MPTQRIDLMVKQAWTKGDRVYEHAIPIGIKRIGFLIDRTSFTGSEDSGQIWMHLEYSLDGGKSWVDTGPVTTSIGVNKMRDGSDRAFSGVVRDIPDPDNPSRRARGTIRMAKPATIAAELQLVS